jgi:hypothetical protein
VSKVAGLTTDTSRPAAQTVCVTFEYPSHTKNNNSNNHKEQSKQLPHKHFTKSMDYSHPWQDNSQSINSPKLAQPQVSLPISQYPDTSSYPKPSKFTPHFPILFLISFFSVFLLCSIFVSVYIYIYSAFHNVLHDYKHL